MQTFDKAVNTFQTGFHHGFQIMVPTLTDTKDDPTQAI
jgi:hypothetical protein